MRFSKAPWLSDRWPCPRHGTARHGTARHGTARHQDRPACWRRRV